MTEGPGFLRIVWQWKKPGSAALLALAAAWDAVLAIWYSNWIPDASASWVMGLMPVAHVALGAAISFRAVCEFFNRTSVELGGGLLRVSHGPVPSRRSVAVSFAEISEVFALARGASFEVVASLRDGRRVVIGSGITEAVGADFLVGAIRDRIGSSVRAGLRPAGAFASGY